MNCRDVNRIFRESAYVRTGGTAQELACATYLIEECAKLGLSARLEPFDVRMYEEKTAKLIVDGKEIACKSVFGVPNGTVKGELFYLTGTDPVSLSKCKNKIVLCDKPVGYKLHDHLTAHGALGYITYCGNNHFTDHDIDRREIRFETEHAIPAVTIHVSDAIDLVKRECKTVEMTVEQEAWIGSSNNVILDLPGETGETVILSAHYDSTLLSNGVYDNLSGAIGLLYLAEYFASRPRRRGIRFLWCGSEERGLLGSLEYCRMHEEELGKTVLNVNLDMLGSIMGEFVIFSSVNEDMTEYLEKFARRHRVCASVRHAIRSSDSNSFVYYGVPAISFARYTNAQTGLIHTRYDTVDIMSAKRLLSDMKTVAQVTEIFVDCESFPISMEISERIRTETDDYMKRKRPANK